MAKRLEAAREELRQAAIYAKDVSATVWEFAVSIQRLTELGLTETDLRKRGYVEHAEEVTVLGDDGRDFRPSGNLTFRGQSCFILTAAGFLDWKISAGLTSDAPFAISESDFEPNASVLRPLWDQNARKLFANNAVVKRFRWPAMNQEAVLAVFEEEGWPSRIDDPLPPAAEQDPKRRLADTIKCLNRKHETPLMRFMGDGTGQGVLWEPVN